MVGASVGAVLGAATSAAFANSSGGTLAATTAISAASGGVAAAVGAAASAVATGQVFANPIRVPIAIMTTTICAGLSGVGGAASGAFVAHNSDYNVYIGATYGAISSLIITTASFCLSNISTPQTAQNNQPQEVEMVQPAPVEVPIANVVLLPDDGNDEDMLPAATQV